VLELALVGDNALAGRGIPEPVDVWRRGRDSNPWKPSDFSGFQDRRLKPLGHLSARSILRDFAVRDEEDSRA
jgi:hypothetical protein